MTVPPTDDAGADTADRYDWQAAMGAADGLALYCKALGDDGCLSAGEDRRIVCERHEDWVALHRGEAELVSAKHREPSYGAYTTVYQLVGDGGLAHLFSRWCALEEAPTCRLVTTPGLGRGPAQDLEAVTIHLRGQRLAGEAINGEDHGLVIAALCRELAKHSDSLPQIWRDGESDKQREQAARFLSMLTIQHGETPRTVVQHAAPSMYVRPVLQRLGIDVPPEAVWEAVLSLFRARMRAKGPIPQGALPDVLAYRPGTPPSGPAEIERALAARIVTVLDIDLAVRTALANPGGYQPLPRLTRTSRMAVKMETGRCSDNSIERAEQLRLDHQDYWRTRISSDPAARADQERLRRLLLRISDDATAAVPKASDPRGAQLWAELQARLDATPASQVPENMDPDLLLGGICDLANRCRVWFSDSFDVEAEIARRRAQRGGSP